MPADAALNSADFTLDLRPLYRARQAQLRARALDVRVAQLKPSEAGSLTPPGDLANRWHWRLPTFAHLHPVSAGIVAATLAIAYLSLFPPPPTFTPVTPVLAAAPSITPTPTPPAPVPARPVDRLRIPSLGINAPITRLGLGPDGRLEAPQTLYQVGWYKKSPWPGQPGTAIIDGHTGSPRQAGVFKHLDRLKPGAQIIVTKANGDAATFVVRTSAVYADSGETSTHFFANTPTPSLNLISCTGNWNAATQSYDQRWIITATPAQ